MLDEAGIRERIGSVEEPELRRSLGELGLVDEVRLRWGKVIASIGLCVAEHPQADELRRRVVAAVTDASGAREVRVDLVPVDEPRRAELAAVLRRPPGSGQEEAKAPFAAGSSTRVLGISSGKGGVGKSSVTVNLAITLARRGARVAILDADVYGFSVPAMLGVSRTPLAVGDLIVPPVAHGVACLSMGFFVGDDTPVLWRGPMLHKALEQFVKDAAWGSPDMLLVDMPPGTGDVALSMAEHLPVAEVLVVTTPQLAAERVAQRSALAARRLKLPVRGVIENMSWFTGDDGTRYELFGSGGGARLAQDLGVGLLGQVPLVPALRAGGDKGVPVTVSDPEGEASLAFDRLADAVSQLGAARVYRSELRVRQ